MTAKRKGLSGVHSQSQPVFNQNVISNNSSGAGRPVSADSKSTLSKAGKLKRIGLYITPELHSELRKFAVLNDQDMSDVVMEAIKAHISK